MPPHLENRIGTFRSVLAQLQREKQFPAYQVGAMDELCVHWGQVAQVMRSSERHPQMQPPPTQTFAGHSPMEIAGLAALVP